MKRIVKKRRAVLLGALALAAVAAGVLTVQNPRAQALGPRALDQLYVMRYVCVPEVGPAGDALAHDLGTLNVQWRTSIYFINTISLPLSYSIRFSGPDGISGPFISDTLPAGAAETITCQDIAQAVGTPQTTGEGYAFLRVRGGGFFTSVVHTGYTPQVNGGGGLAFKLESQVQGERVGTLAFF